VKSPPPHTLRPRLSCNDLFDLFTDFFTGLPAGVTRAYEVFIVEVSGGNHSIDNSLKPKLLFEFFLIQDVLIATIKPCKCSRLFNCV